MTYDDHEWQVMYLARKRWREESQRRFLENAKGTPVTSNPSDQTDQMLPVTQESEPMTDEVAKVDVETDDAQPILPVSQEARKTACEFGRAFLWWSDDFCERVMRGEKDHYPPAQIMARFEAALATRSPDSAVLVEAHRDVLTERRRQVDEEGWSLRHDDEHTKGELAWAAAYFAAQAACFCAGGTIAWEQARVLWPFSERPNVKPADKRGCLVKAGALIIAEIERLDRQALASFHKGVSDAG